MLVISARLAHGSSRAAGQGAMPPWTPMVNAGPAMGRSTRSGSENRQKPRAVLVRLEEGREAALRERASQVGLTSAAFVRVLIERELVGEHHARETPLNSPIRPDAVVDPNLTKLWRSIAHTAGSLVQIAKLLREQHNRELHIQAEVVLKDCRLVLSEVARLAGRNQA